MANRQSGRTMIFQILILIGLLIVAPYTTGLLVSGRLDRKQRSIGMNYISGFFVLLAVFELIAVPIVFLDTWGFEKIIKGFTVVSALLSGMGVVYAMHSWRNGEQIWFLSFTFKEKSRQEKIQWGIVLLLIAFQLYMALTRASFDGDDAYYIAQSVIADETNVLYRILPYTGLSTSLDHRHAMAVFPIWIAYLARSSGIHATILSHTILPLILIPLTYWIYLEIGKRLCKEKKEQLPAFMIFVCALQIFGNTSIYPAATFFLMRTWQGKSMLANVVIPAMFMVLLWIVEQKKTATGLWGLLFILNIVAAMMSTASVLLNVLLLGTMGIVLAVQEKSLRVLGKMILVCIPCFVYGLLYILL